MNLPVGGASTDGYCDILHFGRNNPTAGGTVNTMQQAAAARLLHCVFPSMLLILRNVSQTVDSQSEVHIRSVAALCAQIGS